MSNIYVAAPWKFKAQAKEVATMLEAAGHTVISRWLTQHEDSTDPRILRQEAIHDLEDVNACDLFILLNYCLSEGKATEFGMAYILRKPIIIIGPKIGNIFHHLPGVMCVANMDELAEQIH